MCTVVILNRPGHAWPLILAANRDEMASRPWTAPGRHWPDRPGVLAGRDDLAGGTWLGLNKQGLVAAMLNRQGTLGPARGKRSRGELALLALDQPDAAAAALVMSELEPRSYRTFNMVVADRDGAFFIAHRDEKRAVAVARLPDGLTMLTAREPNDASSPRIAHHRERFLKAAPPDPDKGDFAAWESLLASTERDKSGAPESAMCFSLPSGFGTVCGSLIALPAGIDGRAGNPGTRPVFRFAAGPPSQAPFKLVTTG